MFLKSEKIYFPYKDDFLLPVVPLLANQSDVSARVVFHGPDS